MNHHVTRARRALSTLSLCALALAGGGCGSSDAPAPDEAAAAVDPATKIEGLHLASEPYTLQPGEEKYYCYGFDLPEDQETLVTKLTPVYGQATHHILFSRSLDKQDPLGFSECPTLIKTTWIPLFAGGVNSTPLELPEGAGFRLPKKERIVMQLHLQNATAAPITDHTTVVMKTVDPSTQLTPAGIFGLDNRKISLDPHATSSATMDCDVPKQLNVFAVLGHMHKHGTQLALSRGATSGAEMLYQEPWSFDQQPTAPLSVTINPGDKVHLDCTWKNDSDATVTYGESSDTEMCAAILYYTPFDDLGGCLNF